MPGWDGNGNFSRVYSWEADHLAGINIIATRMDTDTDNITTNGFGNCLTRDGQGSAQNDLPMNGYNHTTVGNADSRNQYGVVGQIQDNSYLFVAAGGTVDALTVTLAPAVTTLVDGMQIYVRALGANTVTNPTLKLNGTTARLIRKLGNQPLFAGDIVTDMECIFRFNLANLRWELLNPVSTIGVSQTPWAVAAGTADAITAAYTPANPSLTDGLLLGFRASGANTVTAPTFAPDGLAARPIVKEGGAALVAGDIPANLAECLLRYNLANTRWELLNPVDPKIAPVVLESGNVSTGTSTILIVDLSSYTAYKRFELSIDSLVPSSSAAGIVAVYSTDGGGTFITSSTYNSSVTRLDGSPASYDESLLTGNVSVGFPLVSATLWNLVCNLTGFNIAQAATIQTTGNYFNGTVPRVTLSVGTNPTPSANAIKLILDAGTVVSGTYRLVGYP